MCCVLRFCPISSFYFPIMPVFLCLIRSLSCYYVVHLGLFPETTIIYLIPKNPEIVWKWYRALPLTGWVSTDTYHSAAKEPRAAWMFWHQDLLWQSSKPLSSKIDSNEQITPSYCKNIAIALLGFEAFKVTPSQYHLWKTWYQRLSEDRLKYVSCQKRCRHQIFRNN